MRTTPGHAAALLLATHFAFATMARAEGPRPQRPNGLQLQMGAGAGIAGLLYERSMSETAAVRLGAGVMPEIGPGGFVMPQLRLGRGRHAGDLAAGIGVYRLAEEGRTMIIVSHEMGFARNLAGVVHFVADGVIVESGPPKRIFDAPESGRLKSFIRAILH